MTETKPAMPSDRSFGWLFTGVFALVGAFFYPWLFALAAVLAVITVTKAHWLAPGKRAWMKLGALMHHVISPLTLGLIFFALFTPIGLVMRAFGRDALRMRLDRSAPTYWVKRDPAGPADDSFRNMY